MSLRAPASGRPLCAEVSAASGEPLGATASRVEHWLLVEYPGAWPYEVLDASAFAGRVRAHLEEQLAALPSSRLLLVKRPGRVRSRGIRVVYGSTPERGGRFRALQLESYAELLGLDLRAALEGKWPGEPLAQPLLLVCAHGKRDRCCARYGQTLYEALDRRAPEGWTWQASHVGGDRFAGNLVCLPESLYFGRVGPGDVEAVLGGYLEGRIHLDRYRGRSCHAAPVQAAELEVRRSTGLTGCHDLRLLSRRREGEGWRVELLAEVSGSVHTVRVTPEPGGEEVLLTCRAERPKRPRHFAARVERVV